MHSYRVLSRTHGAHDELGRETASTDGSRHEGEVVAHAIEPDSIRDTLYACVDKRVCTRATWWVTARHEDSWGIVSLQANEL